MVRGAEAGAREVERLHTRVQSAEAEAARAVRFLVSMSVILLACPSSCLHVRHLVSMSVIGERCGGGGTRGRAAPHARSIRRGRGRPRGAFLSYA